MEMVCGSVREDYRMLTWLKPRETNPSGQITSLHYTDSAGFVMRNGVKDTLY